MSDYQFVIPRISVGAALQASDLDRLVADGITHVADATNHDDSAFLTDARFHVLFANIGDDGASKVDWFKRLAPWFLAAWAQAGTRFNFHCDAGCNRGPSSAYMALRLLGWPREQALAAIAKARPIADHAKGCVRYADDADMAVQQLGLA